MRDVRTLPRNRFVSALALAALASAGCGEVPEPAADLAFAPTGALAQGLVTNTLPATQPQVTNEDTRLTFLLIENPLAVVSADAQLQVQITVTNGTFFAPAPIGGTATASGSSDVILTAVTNTTGTAEFNMNTALNGSYFQPAANFSGSAQLQMNTQNVDGDVDIDILAITVEPFNDPPVITLPNGAATEDEPRALSITVNDVDLNGNPLKVTLTSDNGTLMTLPVTTGLTFTTGTGSNEASMVFQGSQANVNSALNGLTVTPPLNFVGLSNLVITVDDLGSTGDGDPGVDTDTLKITWAAVNDAPVNTVPGPQSIAEDSNLTFTGATALTLTDVDAPTTLLQVTLSATGGTLTLGSTAGVDIVSGDGVADTTTVFRGTLSQLNTALNGTVFDAATNFVGTATVTMLSSDLGNSGAGGARTDSDSVSITVTGVNDAPVNNVPGAQLASEDVALYFNGANQISITDVDATSVRTTLTVTNGTATLSTVNGLVFQSGDGTADTSMQFTGSLAAVNNALNNMRYLSTANFFGDATLTVLTSDLGGTGTGGTLTDSDVIDISVAPVNDPPDAVNDSLVVLEDSVATALSVLVNDTAAPDTGETITVTAATQPSFGSVTFTTTSVSYTPNPDYFGADNFSYTISDGQLTDTATVSVTVTAQNDPPVASDDSFTVEKSTATTLAVLANDTYLPDAEETLTVTAVGTASNGVVSINGGGGSVLYTPTGGYTGPDTFTYTVSDGSLTAVATVTINVIDVITAPINTVPAAQAMNEDGTLVFSAGNGNPIQVADSNNASLDLLITVTHGVFTLSGVAGLTVNGNGGPTVSAGGTIAALNTALANATFKPTANYNGSATLTLLASDNGNESDEDTVALTIRSVNDAPVNSVPVTVQTATEDVPRGFSGITVSDLDLGAGQLAVSLTSTNGTVITLATVAGLSFVTGDGVGDASMSFTGPLGEVNAALNGMTVTALNNYIGTSSFTLTSDDQGFSGLGGVQQDVDTIDINWVAANDPPINSAPATQVTNEDVPLVFSAANANALSVSDDDAGAAPIKVTLTVTNGTLSVGDPSKAAFITGDGVADASMSFTASLADLNGPAGVLEGTVYTPSTGFGGSATLTMVTDDQGNSGGPARTDTDVVSITVTGINDAPINTVPPTQVIVEDSVLRFSQADGNPIRVSDEDATSLRVSLTAVNGTLTVTGISGAAYDVGDGTNDPTVTFTATKAAINSAGATIQFTPLPDFYGLASLTVLTDDVGATGIGGALIDEDTVDISVTSVNDPPTVNADTASVAEDAAAIVVSVLANDTALPDIGETLVITQITNPNRGGTASTDGQTITYQPAPNFNGIEYVDYTVSDGTVSLLGRLTVTVSSVPDLPVAVDDSASVLRNAVDVVIPVLANDSDGDPGTVLRISQTTVPAHGVVTVDASGTVLKYTPVAGYSGPDTFQYSITDGEGGNATATVAITVSIVENGVPVAVADVVTILEDNPGAIIDVLANDTGVTDDPLVIVFVTQPTNGTVELLTDNTVRYTPNPNYGGTDSFRYSVTDADAETSSADVSITITAVDDIPAATDDAATIDEDTTANVDVLANDLGLGDAAPTVTLVSQPPNGTAVLESDNTITYTPDADYSGQDQFTYRVSDGAQVSEGDVTITITPLADAPVAVTDMAATQVDEAVDVDVLANDTDADGDTLEVTLVGEPSQGTASLVAGLIRYVPSPNFQGNDQLEYTVGDGTGLTDVGVLVIGVGIDTDNDGVVDVEEISRGTDPENPDTDGDFLPDGIEIYTSLTDPLDDDSDDDGILDGNEDADHDGLVGAGETSPRRADTDRDGISDGVERGLTEPQGEGTDPDLFVADADPTTTTNAVIADTDGDGTLDGDEDTNHNGRVDAGERDPNASDAPDEAAEGCTCDTVASRNASGLWFGFSLLWLLRRRRRRG